MDLQVKYLWGLTPVASASLEKVQMFPNMEKLSMRIGCSGSRAQTFGVSAFISASAAEISFEHGKSNVPLAAQLLLLLQQNDQDSVPCKIQAPPCGGFHSTIFNCNCLVFIAVVWFLHTASNIQLVLRGVKICKISSNL
jgi:hypothetical protein